MCFCGKITDVTEHTNIHWDGFCCCLHCAVGIHGLTTAEQTRLHATQRATRPAASRKHRQKCVPATTRSDLTNCGPASMVSHVVIRSVCSVRVTLQQTVRHSVRLGVETHQRLMTIHLNRNRGKAFSMRSHGSGRV
jgi:hypothetical protein